MQICPCCKRRMPQAKSDGRSKELLHDLRLAENAIDALESALSWPNESESFREAVHKTCAQRHGGECTCGAFEHNERVYENSHPWQNWDGRLPKRCPACGMTETDALDNPCGGAQ